jgi:hypothetical protein
MVTIKSFAIASIIYATQLVLGQGSSVLPPKAPTTSDPVAMTIINQAIITLGGRALWMQFGGATAQALISHPGGSSESVGWSDDWSTGQVRFRRDRSSKDNRTFSLISSDAFQTRLLPDGKAVRTFHDNDIAALAIGYPGAALALSLTSRYTCTFNFGQLAGPRFEVFTQSPNSVLITEFCLDPLYPNGEVPLVWEFPKSGGAPLAVALPIWGIMSHTLRAQTIMFTAFQRTNGLVIPSQLQIRRPSGVVDSVTISGTTLSSQLPTSLFAVSN